MASHHILSDMAIRLTKCANAVGLSLAAMMIRGRLLLRLLVSIYTVGLPKGVFGSSQAESRKAGALNSNFGKPVFTIETIRTMSKTKTATLEIASSTAKKGPSSTYIWPFLLLALLAMSCNRHEIYYRDVASRTQIASLKVALDAFEIDYDRLPSTAEGLRALIERPQDIAEKDWHGPFLDEILRDGWGHDFVYRCPGLHNTSGFDIYSCGPDGVSKSGGDDPDDIPNWEKKKPSR
jgi:general secretion pathway protein G